MYHSCIRKNVDAESVKLWSMVCFMVNEPTETENVYNRALQWNFISGSMPFIFLLCSFFIPGNSEQCVFSYSLPFHLLFSPPSLMPYFSQSVSIPPTIFPFLFAALILLFLLILLLLLAFEQKITYASYSPWYPVLKYLQFIWCS